LQAGGWSKSCPDWEESFIESSWTVLSPDLHEAIGKVIVWHITIFVFLLSHQKGSAHIEWSDSASHNETGSEGGQELKEETLNCEHGDHVGFACVIASHLGGIKDHSSHDVNIHSFIESAESLFFHDFTSSF
jgi:hypothetical protein